MTLLYQNITNSIIINPYVFSDSQLNLNDNVEFCKRVNLLIIIKIFIEEDTTNQRAFKTQFNNKILYVYNFEY